MILSNESNATAPSARQADLFEPASGPGAGAATVLVFIIALVLVFGGFYLMGSAFGATEHGFWIFAAGLAADTLGFWLAFGLWPNRKG